MTVNKTEHDTALLTLIAADIKRFLERARRSAAPDPARRA